LFHIGGSSAVLSMGLFGGTVCHFIKEICFSAGNWFKTVEQFQPERVYCGVSQFIEISNAENTSSRDLNSVKLIIPVGGAVAKECSQRVICLLGEQTNLVEVYGSTEMNFLAVKYNPQSDKFGQIGILGAGAQLYIQDIKTREKLGPGRKGKIMAKTENMMIKYLNRDEDNAEFFESDGFGYIGDVGYYDEAGNIFFSYRMKEVLKVDNFWFGPEEIENLLEKNEDVQEACAWGEYDVETGNDQVNVGIVLKRSQDEWSEGRIHDYIGANLPSTRTITGRIYYIKRIPHNPQGKKLRREMKNFVLNLEEHSAV